MNDTTRRSVLLATAGALGLPGCSAFEPDPKPDPPEREWSLELWHHTSEANGSTVYQGIASFVLADDPIELPDSVRLEASRNDNQRFPTTVLEHGEIVEHPDRMTVDHAVLAEWRSPVWEVGDTLRLHWYDEELEAAAVLAELEISAVPELEEGESPYA